MKVRFHEHQDFKRIQLEPFQYTFQHRSSKMKQYKLFFLNVRLKTLKTDQVSGSRQTTRAFQIENNFNDIRLSSIIQLNAQSASFNGHP